MKLAQFLEYLQGRAGDFLRAVEWYRDVESELVYLRDYLGHGAVQRRADEVHENFTWDVDVSGVDALVDLGKDLTSVNFREQAVLFPVSHNDGVVVSLEPDPTRSIHRFVTECRDTAIEVQ